MKTYSRRFWEKQYQQIAAVNPLVAMLTDFDSILAEDFSEVRGTIETVTSAKVVNESLNVVGQMPSGELCKQVLGEINEYGHSLVLLCKRDIVEPGITEVSKELKDILRKCKRDVVLNVEGEEYFIRMQGKEAIVIFGGRRYECKHVSYVSYGVNMEIYLPLEDTKRLFISSHSAGCSGCKGVDKQYCIEARQDDCIILFDRFRDDLVSTPPKPIDFHNKNCMCLTKSMCLDSIEYLCAALTEWQKERSKEAAKQRKSSIHKPSDRVQAVQTEADGTEEIVVPVYRASTVYVSKGGKHKSPVTHSVSGYWRRKSKNDDTLIFVRSFVRGGSKEEKQSLAAGLRDKQKVYRL